MLFKDDKPPTSKEEAVERRVRPPPEKYDPDKRSHWSITMTLAWIIWGEIDAVRNEWDDYRNGCADWVFENDPIARAQTGQIGPQKGSWHLHQWPPSGWNRLYLRAISKNIFEPRQQAIPPPQVAIDELWLTAGEGRIKATALECKNAKAFDGDGIEIPAHRWPHLKRVDDPLTGKAMLSDDNGRVCREVLFPRLDVKELWPKSPPLSEEPQHVESAEPKLLKPKVWLAKIRKDHPQRQNEQPTAYARRLHPLMKEATVTRVWEFKTLVRRLRDK
jgi:hypothetical protein